MEAPQAATYTIVAIESLFLLLGIMPDKTYLQSWSLDTKFNDSENAGPRMKAIVSV